MFINVFEYILLLYVRNNIFPFIKKQVRFFCILEPWMRYWTINYDYYCGFKVIIAISTSFSGAFWCVNGIDYYVENSSAVLLSQRFAW